MMLRLSLIALVGIGLAGCTPYRSSQFAMQGPRDKHVVVQDDLYRLKEPVTLYRIPPGSGRYTKYRLASDAVAQDWSPAERRDKTGRLQAGDRLRLTNVLSLASGGHCVVMRIETGPLAGTEVDVYPLADGPMPGTAYFEKLPDTTDSDGNAEAAAR